MVLDKDRFKEIQEGLKTSTLELDELSVADWMNYSFLSMFAQQEVHLEQAVMFQGSVYYLHTCIQSVVPPEQTKNISEKQ